MTNKILVVIVLYGINLEDSLTYQTLNLSVTESDSIVDLFVYDNSATCNKINVQNNKFNIIYKSDTTNSGISKAYNKAADYASECQKDWLLFLDQDSNIPKNLFSVFNEFKDKFSNEKLFVPVLKQNNIILSPCKFKFMKGSSFSSVLPGILSLENVSVFNSGIFIDLNAFRKVGGYDENVPLDFSDHSFIFRYKKWFSNIVVIPIVIEHELSSKSSDQTIILRRFIQYCKGVRAFSSIEGGKGLLFFWTALRAVKLSFQFKNFQYIKILFDKN
ncbi:glycosyltransferase family protein [Flavobacterium reichenbachii]|uniref:Glycosyltransferase 2-like domain-containing protein n=1 Tax=Flavobacterium reichenbachii TaxID=362418 RepID=A0A085ZLA7_9FLAO|nr:hypothetical protein [Flavobacterium reichenbachii]KFF05221.1 hypothetical protein IW19_06615 [Flavobacterium reichenbachii]OXB16112.1 hypothetical protein B0A68_07540 [Flavobacterium reichenbachii]